LALASFFSIRVLVVGVKLSSLARRKSLAAGAADA
jgi:hypothetical protein